MAQPDGTTSHRVPRATPENRENIVKRPNNEDDVRQPFRNGSRNRGPKTCRFSHPLPPKQPTPTPRQLKTARQAAARHIEPTPMPCGRDICRLHEMGVRTLSTTDAIFGSVIKLQVLIHQEVRLCLCVCVLRDTATPHRVAFSEGKGRVRSA